ncbi:hypothetical protein [Thermomonospora cellulosilytica]|uniref:Uncharacterized protein n=1 Tax=Thermomonospora cellulosilytica TaxID=1411118 RepID=A0A7W3N1W7_9ACTN|nr:hypothetical protein [Thermomonospora cellulosilytica]MBA9005982.1 hypothetical protein [Thermomonospora cellulosilytica]
MIPRGRKVVDAAGAAAMGGMSLQTFRNKRIAAQPAFPQPVNPGRRTALYDAEQVAAYWSGDPMPVLPKGEHETDLLDDLDIAAVRGVKYATVRKERAEGRLVGWVEVCGVLHMPRRELNRQLAERPGRGVGGGRPRKNPPPRPEQT